MVIGKKGLQRERLERIRQGGLVRRVENGEFFK